MAIREILTDWSTPAGGGFQSVMYFDADPATAAAQRTALAAMWTAVADELTSTTRWTVRDAGRVLNEETGELTAFWSTGAPLTGVGGAGPTPVPDASQVLIQWRTGFVYGGREIRGRTFVPGLRYDAVAAGNINPAVVSEIQGEAAALISANVGFGVWSRPTPLRDGILVLASTATCWAEMAVQRGRRR